MLIAVDDFQLEWQPDHGSRVRYKLATEEDWSGWIALTPDNQLLTQLLLSGQPVWYNSLAGALCLGPGYGEPQPDALAAPEQPAAPTPNLGDDDAALQDESSPGDQAVASVDETLRAAALAPPRPWRTAQALLTLRDQLNRRYPGRRKGSDGTIGDIHHPSTSDHYPHVLDGSMGIVTALDVTHDPAGGCDAGRLAQALVDSRDPRLKYVIWNRRIANASAMGGAAPWDWRPYGGANPHDHHVHISVQPVKAYYDATTPWILG